MDTKQLWADGGYGDDNDYDVSIRRIRQEGKDLKVSPEIVDMILIEFFLEIEDDEKKYRTEDNKCSCGCILTNSGTNAIHVLFKRIKDKASLLQSQIDEIMQQDFNKKVNNVLKNRRTVKIKRSLKKAIGFGSFKPPWRT